MKENNRKITDNRNRFIGTPDMEIKTQVLKLTCLLWGNKDNLKKFGRY